VVAVGDFHTAESFPDSLRAKQHSGLSWKWWRLKTNRTGGPHATPAP
jgi:hypothetical protein